MKTKKGKDFWGRRVWAGMHSLPVFVDVRNKDSYIRIWYLLGELLPCDVCKVNLKSKLKSHPPHEYISTSLPSRASFWFSYLIHDLANKHITRYNPSTPKVSPNYDKIKKWYYAQHTSVLEALVWEMLQVLAVTYSANQAQLFLELVVCINRIMPGMIDVAKIKPYLRNKYDLFFCLYASRAQKSRAKLPPYKVFKSYYFSALGEECEGCKT